MLTGAKTWYPALDERCGTYQLLKAEIRAQEKYANEMLRIQRIRQLHERGLCGTSAPPLSALMSSSAAARMNQGRSFSPQSGPLVGMNTQREATGGLHQPQNKGGNGQNERGMNSPNQKMNCQTTGIGLSQGMIGQNQGGNGPKQGGIHNQNNGMNSQNKGSGQNQGMMGNQNQGMNGQNRGGNGQNKGAMGGNNTQNQGMNNQKQGMNGQNQMINNNQNQGVNYQNKGQGQNQGTMGAGNSQHQVMNNQNQGMNNQNQGMNNQKQGMNNKNQGMNEPNQGMNNQNQGMSQNQGINQNQGTSSQNKAGCGQNHGKNGQNHRSSNTQANHNYGQESGQIKQQNEMTQGNSNNNQSGKNMKSQGQAYCASEQHGIHATDPCGHQMNNQTKNPDFSMNQGYNSPAMHRGAHPRAYTNSTVSYDSFSYMDGIGDHTPHRRSPSPFRREYYNDPLRPSFDIGRGSYAGSFRPRRLSQERSRPPSFSF